MLRGIILHGGNTEEPLGSAFSQENKEGREELYFELPNPPPGNPTVPGARCHVAEAAHVFARDEPEAKDVPFEHLRSQEIDHALAHARFRPQPALSWHDREDRRL